MRALPAPLRRVLADDRIVRYTLALTALLTFHVVFQGFAADDHALRGMSLRLPPWQRWPQGPTELFSFYDGDPGRTMEVVDYGFSPWWTDPHLRLMFFRPLSSLLHWVDFRVGPAAFAHAESVLVYLAVVAVVGSLYRRILGATWVAGFAAVIFAFDHNHGVLVEWISNRNALVAGLFGALALLLHDRARREERWSLAMASAASLGLAFGGGEGALGAAFYLVAYAIFLDDRPRRARVAGLLPHALVLVAWLVVYRVGHFGAHGSGIYIDPAESPRAFLRGALANVPLLLQSELGGFPPDILLFLGRIPWWAIAGAIALVGAALVAFAPLLRDPRARFFLAGAILSTLPAAATFPSGRLLLLPSFGLLGITAMVVEGVVDRTVRWRPGPARWAAVFTAAWIGIGHLVLSPLLGQVVLVQLWLLERTLTRFSEGMGDDPALARQRVVIVNPPDVFFAYYTAMLRATAGRVTPAKMLVLASGKRGMELERTDAGTLVVRPDGGFFQNGTDLLTRRADLAMPPGTRVSLVDITIDVTRADPDGVPTEAAFHFARGLEDDGLRWMTWRGQTLVPFDLPEVGEKLRIEGQTPSI